MHDTMTFREARDWFAGLPTTKSPHTIKGYTRALDLFLEFLADVSEPAALPIQHKPSPTVADLTRQDAPIIAHYIVWLSRRYSKRATVELRYNGVKVWFQTLEGYGHLPQEFSLNQAVFIAKSQFNPAYRGGREAAPEPPKIELLLDHFATLPMPEKLQKLGPDHERVRRWELERLRDQALVMALAETGGRISELLSLDVEDFAGEQPDNEVLRVRVLGKGHAHYDLRFLDSLPAIRAYIEARGTDLVRDENGTVALFVYHTRARAHRRMTRFGAWQAIRKAGEAVGLESLHPHDFRHWRATQLLNADVPLDVVQDYLGHMTIQTTRTYYAFTRPERIDDAARRVHVA